MEDNPMHAAKTTPSTIANPAFDNPAGACKHGCGFVGTSRSLLQAHEASCLDFYTAPDATDHRVTTANDPDDTHGIRDTYGHGSSEYAVCSEGIAPNQDNEVYYAEPNARRQSFAIVQETEVGGGASAYWYTESTVAPASTYAAVYSLYAPTAVPAFFRGAIDRQTAEAELASKPAGSFVVRTKTGTENLVVSLVAAAACGETAATYRHEIVVVKTERDSAAAYGEVTAGIAGTSVVNRTFSIQGKAVGDPPANSLEEMVGYLSTDATLLRVLLIDHGLMLRADGPTAALAQPSNATPPALASSAAPIATTEPDCESYEMPTQTKYALPGGEHGGEYGGDERV